MHFYTLKHRLLLAPPALPVLIFKNCRFQPRQQENASFRRPTP